MPQLGSSIKLVRTRRTFDPQSGWATIEEWEGSRNACTNKQSEYAAVNVRSDLSHDGPHWRLTVTIGEIQRTGGEEEVPVDTWEVDTEWVQNSIYENSNVLDAAGSVSTLAQWRKEIERAMKKDAPALDTQTPTNKVYLFNHIVRGVEAYESKRIVLSRVRTISVGYAGQFTCDAVDKIYTTGRLINDFLVPAAIASRLPADPSYTPDNSAWSWKQRRASSKFQLRMNKVEEVFDFVFAAWSVLLYDLQS